MLLFLKIERSDMDGSNRQVLVTQDVVWPNGLVIDYSVNHIYWYVLRYCLPTTRTTNKKDINLIASLYG